MKLLSLFLTSPNNSKNDSMLNKLENRLANKPKKIKFGDIIKVMQFVGIIDETYRRVENGIIEHSRFFKVPEGEIELCQTFLSTGGNILTTLLLFVTNHPNGGSGIGRYSDPPERETIETTPLTRKLVEFFLKNKDDLIKLSELMGVAHNLHKKYYGAHMARKKIHDEIHERVTVSVRRA